MPIDPTLVEAYPVIRTDRKDTGPAPTDEVKTPAQKKEPVVFQNSITGTTFYLFRSKRIIQGFEFFTYFFFSDLNIHLHMKIKDDSKYPSDVEVVTEVPKGMIFRYLESIEFPSISWEPEYPYGVPKHIWDSIGC